MKANITDQEFIHSLSEYHERELCWGNLHIAMDDGNLEDDNIQWCLKFANEEGDQHGARLAQMLLELSYEDREKLYEMNL